MDISVLANVEVKGSEQLNQLSSSLQHAGDSAQTAASKLREVEGVLGPLGAGAAIAVAGLLALASAAAAAGSAVASLAEQAGKYAEKMQNAAAATQMSVEDIQRVKYAAEVAGVSFEGIVRSVDQMSKKLEEGDSVFRRLGLSIDQLKRESPTQAFQELLARINELPPGLQRTTALMEIFGKGGATAVAPLLSTFSELTGEADHFGSVLSGEAISSAAQFDDELDRVSEAVRKIALDFGSAVASSGAAQQALHALAEVLAEVAGWVEKNRGAITELTNIIASWGATTANALGNLASQANEFANTTGGKVVLGMMGIDVEGMQAGAAYLGAYNTPGQGFESHASIGGADFKSKKDEEAAKKAEDAWVKAANESQRAWQKFYSDSERAGEQLNNSAEKWEMGRIAKLEDNQQRGSDRLGREIEEDFLHKKEQEAKAMEEMSKWAEKTNAEDRQIAERSFQRHIDQLHELGTAFSQIAGILGSLGAGGLGSVAGGIGGGVNALADFKNALHGDDFFAKLTGGLGLVSAGIGLVQNIISAFHKPEYEKAMDDVGKSWGVSISEGLGKAIESTEAKDHVSRQMAELLHVDDIIKESGKDPSAFAGQIGDLMNAVKLGAVPAAEGIQQLGKAFNDLKTAAEGGSVASEKAMIDMIKRARELGESIPEIDAYVKASLDSAIKGLDAFFGGMVGTSGKKGGPGLSAEQAAANQQIFGATFSAEAAQLGAVAAAEKMQPVFDKMMAALPKGTALTGDTAAAARLMELLKVDQFKGAATAAQGGADALKGLMDAGYLSQKTLDAFGTSAKTLEDQANQAALGKGLSVDDARIAAEQSILPLLTQLQKSESLGGKLNKDEKDMLAQAQKDGILPLKDVATQQLDVLKQIRDAVRGGGAAGGGGMSEDQLINLIDNRSPRVMQRLGLDGSS